MATWEAIYLKNALARLQANTEGFNWTVPLVYAAQQMCKKHGSVGTSWNAELI